MSFFQYALLGIGIIIIFVGISIISSLSNILEYLRSILNSVVACQKTLLGAPDYKETDLLEKEIMIIRRVLQMDLEDRNHRLEEDIYKEIKAIKQGQRK
jgi:hypothetical protein